jgi:L-threonylcarbamoyladenylate synthase
MKILKAPRQGASLGEAAQALLEGALVAAPTETFYGLLVRYDHPPGLRRLWALKGREPQKPFPLIVGSAEALALVVARITPLAQRLMEGFWPGPLSILFEAREGLSSFITARGKVAVRMPGDSPALQLAKAVGLPLTATSANPSGAPPARSAEEVLRYFPLGLDLLLDGGRTEARHPSTLVEATEEGLRVLREGAIPKRRLEEFLGQG